MKEIKAYVRCDRVSKVIQALEENGVTGLTVIDVMAVGPSLIDPVDSKDNWSIKLLQRFAEVAKVELIIADEKVDELVGIIRQNAHTFQKGDGIIFISPIEGAFKIRSGKTDEEAIK